MQKPKELFDRDHEWHDLVSFAGSSAPGLQLGIVYGRRRQGKTYLLRRLLDVVGGMYVMPLEEQRLPALRRFADAVSQVVGVRGLSFDDWYEALSTAIDGVIRFRNQTAGPPLIVLDELPYLLAHSPELPSALQRLYDEAQSPVARRDVRIVLCGSAFSIMTDLLSGAKALRGRSVLDLCLQPFDFPATGQFWRIADPQMAFRIHAIVGGTPGYRALIDREPPRQTGDLGRWLGTTLLNPAHALFNEIEYLLREDPRITDRALYQSVLRAIANGAGTPSQVGAMVGRPAQALAHPLNVLETAGFVRRIEDLQLQRRARLQIADPIVRFHQLITLPRLAQAEERRASELWSAATETFASNVLGPHFENVARAWAGSRAGRTTLELAIGAVGPVVVNDPAGRAQHQIDVAGLHEGILPRTSGAKAILLGEAKFSATPRTLADLERLERVRAMMVSRDLAVSGAKLVIFAGAGADRDLARVAASRADVHVVDLDMLYAS